MKTLIALLLFTVTSIFGQDRQFEKFSKAKFLIENQKTKEAFDMLAELKNEIPKKDTLYNYIIWYRTAAAGQLVTASLNTQDYEHSLQYSLAILDDIEENTELFERNSPGRKYFAVKDIIVSYTGLNKLNEVKKYKDILYEAYKNDKLPEGLNGYFNFDFFKLGDKNIWGYEWYPELPENRFSTSFTKVVYYVYSTNADGSDKDQLYRLHVLMFHQDSKNTKFDYILEKQRNTDDQLLSGSYYKYTYKKDIDYIKLHNDIIEIVTRNTEPDTKRTTATK